MNRDLSWLKFNRRVLEEAEDETTPLLERVKFLSIVSTNLDEFMSIRVARIIDQIQGDCCQKDFSGYYPNGLLQRIVRRTRKLIDEQYVSFREVSAELSKHGIIVRSFEQLDSLRKQELNRYYDEKVLPVLTPMAIDQSRPFPLIHSRGLYLAIVLTREDRPVQDEPLFAIVQVPANLPRLISIPLANKNSHQFILLEELIKAHIGSLFTDYIPEAVHCFRVTRNADFTVDEEETEDLVEEMQKEIRRRRWGNPVRLEIETGIHPFALKTIQEELELRDLVYAVDGPIDLSYFMTLSESVPGLPQLRYPRVEPIYPVDMNKTDVFPVLKQKDILLFHPYESFQAVNDFLEASASDSSVLAIKMTLYRVSGNSPIVHALARAAEAGKQVTVLIEIKARFDEERNIAWARELEKAGCHVVYGLAGLKTHSKLTLVVRQEGEMLKRYVHVSTGNYNDSTARLFTDIGLLTSHPQIGEDISTLFNEITGFSTPRHWHHISVAPTDLKQTLIDLIHREMDNRSNGKPARIIAKMNSLSNRDMIDQLYAASQAGVRIDLIVRGICALKPGIPGISENITVRSIIDRYLEHSRVFYFENGGDPRVYISSADWMTRNLTRRIELICPILDSKLSSLLIDYLTLILKDNVKARIMLPSGRYVRVNREQLPIRSQFEARSLILDWKSR